MTHCFGCDSHYKNESQVGGLRQLCVVGALYQ